MHFCFDNQDVGSHIYTGEWSHLETLRVEIKTSTKNSQVAIGALKRNCYLLPTTILSYLRCGRYPSFLAFELCPLLLWCIAALRVQPCAGGRRFSTSNSHHRAGLCWRAGVLGSR